VKKADAVFEGGGVKGLGLVGALTVAEENGYTDWRRVAGTSAGAIVASLLAAGYSAEELKEILMDLEYSELLYYTRPRDVLFHPIGFFSRVFFDYGVNKSSPIRDWLEDRLGARGVETFADLKLDNSDGLDEYSLRIIASDITERNMLICFVSAFMSGKSDFDKHHFPLTISLDDLLNLPNINTGGLTKRWANEDPFPPKKS